MKQLYITLVFLVTFPIFLVMFGFVWIVDYLFTKNEINKEV